MSRSNIILCVLSEGQYQEWATEFERFHELGVELRFEQRPDHILEIIAHENPQMIVLGSQFEHGEGTAFLDTILQDHGEFDKPVVVLPNKDAGRWPMMYYLTQATGRPSIETLPFEEIARLLAGLLVEAAEDETPSSVSEERAAVPASKTDAASSDSLPPRLSNLFDGIRFESLPANSPYSGKQRLDDGIASGKVAPRAGVSIPEKTETAKKPSPKKESAPVAPEEVGNTADSMSPVPADTPKESATPSDTAPDKAGFEEGALGLSQEPAGPEKDVGLEFDRRFRELRAQEPDEPAEEEQAVRGSEPPPEDERAVQESEPPCEDKGAVLEPEPSFEDEEAVLEPDTSPDDEKEGGPPKKRGASPVLLKRIAVPAASLLVLGLFGVVGYLAFAGTGDGQADQPTRPATSVTRSSEPSSPKAEKKPEKKRSEAIKKERGSAVSGAPSAPPPEAGQTEVALTPVSKDLVASSGEKTISLWFRNKSASPRVPDRYVMPALLEQLNATPDARIVLTGYTSENEVDIAHYKLALIRVENIMKVLVREGIPAERFELRIRGHTNPAVSSEEEQIQNQNHTVTYQLISSSP